jgi:capsular polysaccharide biosynthesis protein
VNDPDPALGWSNGMGDDLPELLWDYDGLSAVEDRPSAGLPGGLVSLAFITAALKRRAWVWCLLAVLGLIIGGGLNFRYPPAAHASASVLLVDNPNQDPATQINNDQAIAQSEAVASLVVSQLGLKQTVNSFQAASAVAVVSDNVLLFNVGAPTASDAVVRVTALATEFLKFRAQYEQDQQQQELNNLSQQFSQAQSKLDLINTQINQVSAEPTSRAQQDQLTNLDTQRGVEDQIEQYATDTKATTLTNTAAMVNGSKLLGPALAIPKSHLRAKVLYIGGGLLGGLALGIALVIIAELASDRLRRRDDVAQALGAPVRLSVGALRRGRLPGRPGGAAKRGLNMKRVVAHLRGTVVVGSPGAAGLAVVAVDNAKDAAPAVVSLAVACARDGRQVVVADLAGGALADHLGAKGPGIHPVTVQGARLIAVVPDGDDITPTGPFPTRAQHAPASEALIAACASADLLITLAALDPASGGDHLATWATDAVAIVTAGQSSAVRVHAVGEMIRLAGTRLNSAVLIRADKRDESLGVTIAQEKYTQIKLN